MRTFKKRIVAFILFPALLGQTTTIHAWNPAPPVHGSLSCSQEALGVLSGLFFNPLGHHSSTVLIAAFWSVGSVIALQGQVVVKEKPTSAMQDLVDASERWYAFGPSETALEVNYWMKYPLALKALREAVDKGATNQDLGEAVRRWDQARNNADAARALSPIRRQPPDQHRTVRHAPRILLHRRLMKDLVGSPRSLSTLWSHPRLSFSQKKKWLLLLLQEASPTYQEVMESWDVRRNAMAALNGAIEKINQNPGHPQWAARQRIAEAEFEEADEAWRDYLRRLGITAKEFAGLLPNLKIVPTTPPFISPKIQWSA